MAFVVIGHIFSRFGILYKEKSGNPDPGKSIISIAEAFRCLRDSWASKEFLKIKAESATIT
jgi:hypothetical protein